jgi:hypothetical protein
MKPTNILLAASFLLIACDPYDRFVGEFNAGPVNPAMFPKPYLGAGGDPKFGGGVFKPSMAYVAGAQIGYYPFPVSAAQAKDPLTAATIKPPIAYVFDPGPNSPYPASPRCTPPPRYVYDQQRDGIRYDEQGALFTALPKSDSYVPVVAEVPVTSKGEGCQSIKTTDTLLSSSQVAVNAQRPASGSKPVGIADNKYLAWAIIDPSAEVDPLDPATGVGPQRYGWYQHFLVVYLDGGYLPASADGAQLVPQTLYVPLKIPGTDANGRPAVQDNSAPGSGYDVLEGKRGDTAYSPLCHIKQFTPPDPTNPLTSAAAISGAVDTNTYVYCLQTL